MSDSLLDFSRRRELSVHASILADVETVAASIGAQLLIVGAFASWTVEDDFDYERAGARMLGYDVRSLLDEDGVERIGGILSEQSDQDTPGLLPNEMSAAAPEKARALLEATLGGILGNW